MQPAGVMDRLLFASPVPARVSADRAEAHAEPRMRLSTSPILASVLIGQSSGLKSSADDDLVAEHGVSTELHLSRGSNRPGGRTTSCFSPDVKTPKDTQNLGGAGVRREPERVEFPIV